jgi:prevent-host-death family protein
MKETITITEAKARLSALVERLIQQEDKIFITRKGRPAAVLLSVHMYQELTRKDKPGLAEARGALGDLEEELEEMLEIIYTARDQSKGRKVAF